MERELWKFIVAALKHLPPTRPRNAVFSDPQILAVLLWAALHDRPVSWACRRSSWPVQAWRRKLPDQSTMSRRMRDPALLEGLASLIQSVQHNMPRSDTIIVDGKALPLSDRARDPDATNGWASRGHARGYKLHAIVDTTHRLLAFEIEPMNQAESTTARSMVERVDCSMCSALLGDAAYDSNPLHAACSKRGITLLAPRRRPDHPLCKNRKHEPSRIASAAAFESGSIPEVYRQRTGIERFFSRLAVGARLFALPPWVRRLHRVRLWVAAKLAINAAIITQKYILDA